MYLGYRQETSLNFDRRISTIDSQREFRIDAHHKGEDKFNIAIVHLKQKYNAVIEYTELSKYYGHCKFLKSGLIKR
jgi:hypothetical protein